MQALRQLLFLDLFGNSPGDAGPSLCWAWLAATCLANISVLARSLEPIQLVAHALATWQDDSQVMNEQAHLAAIICPSLNCSLHGGTSLSSFSAELSRLAESRRQRKKVISRPSMSSPWHRHRQKRQFAILKLLL